MLKGERASGAESTHIHQGVTTRIEVKAAEDKLLGPGQGFEKEALYAARRQNEVVFCNNDDMALGASNLSPKATSGGKQIVWLGATPRLRVEDTCRFQRRKTRARPSICLPLAKGRSDKGWKSRRKYVWVPIRCDKDNYSQFK
jgi:hypothetical protein